MKILKDSIFYLILFSFLSAYTYQNGYGVISILCLGVASCLSFMYVQNTNELTLKKIFSISILLMITCLVVQVDDDCFRYFSEAELLLKGGNPYLLSPSETLSRTLYAHQCNHPEWTAIYGPLFIHFMSVLVLIGQSFIVMKLTWFVFHCLNMLLLKHLYPNKKVYAFYGLSPFILMETVGHGHFEQLLVFSFLIMAWAFKRHSQVLYAIGLTCGIWLKWWLAPIAVLLFKRSYFKGLFLAALFSCVIVFPFINEFSALFTSLIRFEKLSSYGYVNQGLTYIFGEGVHSVIAFTLLLRLLYMFLLGGCFENQVWGFFKWFLILAPTLHPWYIIIPAVAGLCLGNKYSFLILSITAPLLHLAEAQFNANGIWSPSLLHAVPLFMILFLNEKWIRRFIFFKKGPWVQEFTVITPVMNEEENLKELGTLMERDREFIKEWIVVDAGSTDHSKEIAEQAGATFLTSPIKGRGQQIAYGADNAKQDWVVILHSDTRLENHAFQQIQQHIYNFHGLVGGAFKMCYRGYHHLGPLFFLNDIKTRFLGISFGDQTQFFNKNKLSMPNLFLMEDVELSLKMKGKINVFIKKAKSSTSPRRWLKVGRMKNSLLIIKLLWMYFLTRQLNDRVDVKSLYERYYSK